MYAVCCVVDILKFKYKAKINGSSSESKHSTEVWKGSEICNFFEDLVARQRFCGSRILGI